MDPFIGQIMMFGGNFAPRGWALCNGQLLAISANSALFSILGTTYGGDGRTTFGLPDLRGRSPMHVGAGPGLSPITWGGKGGAEVHTLTVGQMPNHIHDGSALKGTLACNEEDGTTDDPQGMSIGVAASGTPYNNEPNDKVMKANDVSVSGSTGPQGGGQSFNIRNPYLGTNFVIALQGIYPSRS